MDARKIPERLRKLDQWVNYKLPSKMPICSRTNQPASSTDKSTWSPFDIAHANTRHDGVGFVFSGSDGVFGVDLDGCRNRETMEIAPWARHIVKKLASYAEVSPSGTGIKIWCAGKSPFDGGRKFELPDLPKVTDEKSAAIEVYDRGRYFCVTGKRLQGFANVTVVSAEQVHRLIADALGHPIDESRRATSGKMPDFSDDELMARARKYVEKIEPAVSGSGGHNQTFCVACVLVLGFCLTPDQAMPIMQEYSQRCSPPWSERELLHKVKSANQQSGPRGYLRDKEYRRDDVSAFSTREQEHTQAPKSPPSTLVDLHEATIEYVRSLDTQEQSKQHSTGLTELDYALSGGIEPGEMVIVAGRPGHGKSAFGMQMVHSLSRHMPCLVISEEMNISSLAKRSIQFLTDAHEDYWAVNARQLTSSVDTHFGNRQKVLVATDVGSASNAFALAEKAKGESGVGCVLVDYAQLLTAKGSGRYEQVTNASIQLAKIARELGLITIVLCQCNRQLEGRANSIPNTSDLRDSGQLEQDADVILFGVWYVRLRPDHKPPGEYVVSVAKSRNREIKQQIVRCTFEARRMRLVDAADVQSTIAHGFNSTDNPFDEALR